MVRDGQFDRSMERCKKRLEKNPNSARVYADLGASLVGLGRTIEAERACKQSLSIDDRLASTHAILASVIAQQDPQEALAHLRKACQLEPSAFEYHASLANLANAINPKEAIEHFESALAIRPNDVETLLRIGMAWDSIGEHEKGIQYLEKITKLMPNWREAKQALDDMKKRGVKTDQ